MGRYITTTGTASAVTREVSTTYTAVVNDRILADSSGGAFTITLPVSTSLIDGDLIQLIDVTTSFGSNNVTLARNGAKIQGATEDLVVDVDGTSLVLLYTGDTYGWIVTAS